MSTVSLILKAKQQFYRSLVYACVLAFVVIFVTTLVQIFMRRVLHSPLEWPEDLAVFLFIWITFLGAAILFERNMLISIDSAVILLPDRGQQVCHAISRIIILISLCYLFYLSWEFLMRQRALDHNLGGALLIPSWVIMIPVIISVVGMIVSSSVSTILWISNRGNEA